MCSYHTNSILHLSCLVHHLRPHITVLTPGSPLSCPSPQIPHHCTHPWISPALSITSDPTSPYSPLHLSCLVHHLRPHITVLTPGSLLPCPSPQTPHHYTHPCISPALSITSDPTSLYSPLDLSCLVHHLRPHIKVLTPGSLLSCTSPQIPHHCTHPCISPVLSISSDLTSLYSPLHLSCLVHRLRPHIKVLTPGSLLLSCPSPQTPHHCIHPCISPVLSITSDPTSLYSPLHLSCLVHHLRPHITVLTPGSLLSCPSAQTPHHCTHPWISPVLSITSDPTSLYSPLHLSCLVHHLRPTSLYSPLDLSCLVHHLRPYITVLTPGSLLSCPSAQIPHHCTHPCISPVLSITSDPTSLYSPLHLSCLVHHLRPHITVLTPGSLLSCPSPQTPHHCTHPWISPVLSITSDPTSLYSPLDLSCLVHHLRPHITVLTPGSLLSCPSPQTLHHCTHPWISPVLSISSDPTSLYSPLHLSCLVHHLRPHITVLTPGSLLSCSSPQIPHHCTHPCISPVLSITSDPTSLYSPLDLSCLVHQLRSHITVLTPASLLSCPSPQTPHHCTHPWISPLLFITSDPTSLYSPLHLSCLVHHLRPHITVLTPGSLLSCPSPQTPHHRTHPWIPPVSSITSDPTSLYSPLDLSCLVHHLGFQICDGLLQECHLFLKIHNHLLGVLKFLLLVKQSGIGQSIRLRKIFLDNELS